MSNLEMMLPPRQLANLRSNVELPSQIALLFFKTLIVESKTTLDQMIQGLKELPHHPLG
ncbi:hypothetical protein D3C81_1624520 [compost metagenome]